MRFSARPCCPTDFANGHDDAGHILPRHPTVRRPLADWARPFGLLSVVQTAARVSNCCGRAGEGAEALHHQLHRASGAGRTALPPFSITVAASPDWRAIAAAIWQQAQPALPRQTARIILHVHADADQHALVARSGPPTPLPLLAAWIERCRDRWPAVDLVICWQSAAGGSASTAAGLSGLAEHQDAQLVDLRRTERARLRVDGVPLSVPLLWLVPGILFLFAPVIASATDGLHGARVALARAVQPDGLMASFTPPVVPMLSVLDVRQVTAVVGSEQLVVARPGALVVAADPAAADALAAKVLADTGKPAEALRSVEPERVAEQWEATLTRQANAIGRRAAAVLGQPALTRLPGSLRRLRGVPR